MWNDRRLVRRAARGDSDAFAAIFRRYEQDLYRYCVAILGDSQDAQDALQNTMVKALRSLPGERREIELKPWLYRVAHNESIELRRRARPSDPLPEELPATVASLEETAADRVRLRDLLADIAELPARHRGALVMRELAGLDFEEIGAALDTSPGAARQVLYEARRGLQQMSEGREMECDRVTALLSDHDGRIARRRDVRAHLRDCPECRRFAEGIRSRSETLAGIAPLPAIAAAAMLKGALAGTASGGAATAASGGSAVGVGGGMAGGASGGGLAVASGAAKVASTGAILKSAAAIAAVVAVGGAVAVDQGQLLGGGGSPANQADHPASVARGGGQGPDARTPLASGGRHLAANAVGASNAFRPGHASEVGIKGPPTRTAKTTVAAQPDATATEPVTAAPETASPASPGNSGYAQRAAKAGRSHPAHPAHPAHPTHPARSAKPVHPTKPAHPQHPSHPEGTGHATDTGAAVVAGAETEQAPAAESKAVEAGKRPAHSMTPAEEAGADERAEAAKPSGKPTEPPGLADKAE